MKYDTILLAGDRKSSRSVFGRNKSLLEINGTPLFIHALSALQSVKDVGNIYIVGPKASIDELLQRHSDKLTTKKKTVVVEQRDTLYENVWDTFLSIIPDYKSGNELRDPLLMDKSIFVLAGDVPLITSFEIEEFLSKCDMVNYDYCIGMTEEEVMKNYYPYDNRPGIRLAYLYLHRKKYRVNNLHLLKPFKIKNREYIEKMYEYRYQKDLRNIIMLTIEIVKRHAGFKSLFLYSIVEMSLLLFNIHLEFFSPIFRRFAPVKSAEKIVSDVLGTRLKAVETSFGGAALDVDNERDFNTIKIMYKEWMEYQKKVQNL
jgi:molybdopterin-guanine dinucleotide biosynthesis protein A